MSTGADVIVEADPDTPLLYVLRNDLGLRAAKLGCGLEQCRACAVLADGEAVPTCVTPLSAFAGRAHRHARGPRRRRAPARRAAGVPRRGGGAVRLLHRRDDHRRGRAARAHPRPQRGGDPRGARPAPLPLRVALARDPRGPPRRRSALVSALPAALAANPDLDTWVRIDEADTVTVFTGKAELGQGLVSALARVAADELDVAFERVRVRTADTDHPLDERITAGSLSMMSSGTALRQAAAEVRALLLERAAQRLGAASSELAVHDGTISAPGASVTYWQLAGGRPLAAPRERAGRAQARRRAPRRRGERPGAQRPARDRRRERALRRRPRARGHAARQRRAGALARGRSLVRAGEGIPGVVRNGSFLGVLAEREEQAVSAAELLRARSRWSAGPPLAGAALTGGVAALAAGRGVPRRRTGDRRAPRPAPDETIEWTHAATYTRPYLMHGSLGPSAALAHWDGERLEVGEPHAGRLRAARRAGPRARTGAERHPRPPRDRARLLRPQRRRRRRPRRGAAGDRRPRPPRARRSGRARTSTAGSPTGHPRWSSCERDSTRRGGSATGATTCGARPTAAGRCRAAR